MYSRDIVELEDKIRIHESKFGEDDPRLVEPLEELAHLHFMFERFYDAERLLWRAVAICGKRFGSEDLSVTPFLSDLGYLYETETRWSEAEHVYRLAYAIKASRLGPSHRESLLLARNVVAACRAQGKRLSERELERLSRIAV